MDAVLIPGDCREVLSAFPEAHFDCVIADPPYGETSLAWDRWQPGWPEAIRRVLKPTGSMWCFGSLRMFMAQSAEFTGWRLSHDVVWRKQNGSGFQNDRFRRVHELAAHWYRSDAPWADVYKAPQYSHDATPKTVRRKTRPTHTGHIECGHYESQDGGPRLLQSVIEEPNCHGFADHPTQKPEALIETLMRYACPEGGKILDPFAGAGTTGLVATRLGRDCTMIELNPEYVKIIERRLCGDLL